MASAAQCVQVSNYNVAHLKLKRRFKPALAPFEEKGRKQRVLHGPNSRESGEEGNRNEESEPHK